MKKLRFLNCLLVVGGSLSLCGCGASLPTHYYLLQASGKAQGVEVASEKLKVRLTSVRLPKYLDRKPIVTKKGDNEIVLSDLHLWGEPLEENIKRVLLEEFESRGVDVLASSSESTDQTVELNIAQFERTDEGSVTLRATWSIESSSDNKEVPPKVYGETVHEIPCAGVLYPDTVSCMSESLSFLAEDLLKAL